MLTSFASLVLAANVFTPTIVLETRPSPEAPPTLQLGVLSAPLMGELSSSALAWALSNRGALGLHPASTLVFDAGFTTRFGASLHYRQQLDGLDVYQAKLVLTLDAQRRIVQVSSSLVGPRPVRSVAVMTEARAREQATEAVTHPVLDDTLRGVGGSRRHLFDTGTELHVGYLLHVASYDVTKNWYVAVDAITSETLFVQDRVHHAEFDANVYPISPGGLDGGVGRTPTTIAPLVLLDGGSLIASTCEFVQADGGVITIDNDGGLICANNLTAYNCCTNAGCVADAGSKRLVGPTSITIPGTTFRVTLNVDLPLCDLVNQATNQRDGGDYRYEPVDPPSNAALVELNDPANSDTFAQVHAFYQVSRAAEWVRGLSTRATPLFPQNQPAIGPFRMRDERRQPPRRPAVVTNVVVPNFQALRGVPACLPPQFGGSGMGACTVDGFTHVESPQFVPVENFAAAVLSPGLLTGVDTLIISQANAADPAYDATVLWHEFGHGVVYATAALTFMDVARDNRSANNEGGALHEAFSDYLAGAFGRTAQIGPYFGPRAVPAGTMNGALRSLENPQTCPSGLWGQVHQDSQHVSAALWAGRTANLGTDDGATFDAAFYAMLVSLAPNADFARVADVMTARVTTALGPTAGAAMAQAFQTRGVTGCSKTLDVTDASQPRPYFGISGSTNSTWPGPFQFKLRVPNGAQAVRVRGIGGGGGFGGAMPMLSVLVKRAQPVTFSTTGALTNDADVRGTITAGNAIDGRVPLAVPCDPGQEIFVALTGAPSALRNLEVTAEPLVGCELPSDGGTAMDAGMTEPIDAGPVDETKRLPAVSLVSQPTALTGCGCSANEGAVLLGALALLRSSSRRRSTR